MIVRFVDIHTAYLEAILTLDFSFDCVCFPVLIVLRPCSSMSTDFRYALLFSKKEKFPKATEKCPTAKIIAVLLYRNLSKKYRKKNVSGIKDGKQRIKENMKKIKEKFIQRINQVEQDRI
jgi:hypothetical protein